MDHFQCRIVACGALKVYIAVTPVISTASLNRFLAALQSIADDLPNICGTSSNGVLQDGIELAATYLGPQKGLIYAILESRSGQIPDENRLYSKLQPLNQTVGFISKTVEC